MPTGYIQFTDEQKEKARRTDLAELLCSQGETVKRSGKEFEWRDGSAMERATAHDGRRTQIHAQRTVCCDENRLLSHEGEAEAFFKWGISFDEKHPYEIPDQGNRKVEYAEKKDILDGIVKKYRPDLLEPPTPADDEGGMLGNQEQQMTEKNESNPAKPQNRDRRRNGGAAVQTAPRNRRNPMPGVSQEQEAPYDAQA